MYRITCRSRAASGTLIAFARLGVVGRMYVIMAGYHLYRLVVSVLSVLVVFVLVVGLVVGAVGVA